MRKTSRSSFWTRYKKWIVAGALGLGLLFTLTAFGVGYLVYQTASWAKENFTSWATSETPGRLPTPPDADVVLPTRGWAEGFVIAVAGSWLQQSLAQENLGQLKDGLSCVDAIGGPSPQTLVKYLKTQLSDERVGRELDSLVRTLNEDATAPGPAACASWMLNG